jgi:hypothetical protein
MRRIAAWIGAIVVALVGWPPAAVAQTAPIVVIVMENHSYGPDDGSVSGDTTKYIVGNPDAPYVNGTLVPEGTLFTNYYGNAHPSLPNYLDLTAGTEAGCTTDACAPDSLANDNLFQQLGSAGFDFATFAQSMPSNCATSDSSPYVVHHNPEAYFTDIDAASGLPYSCPITDVPLPSSWPDPLPDLSLVIPDNCHNMHGASSCPGGTDQIIRDGDAWLSTAVPALLSLGALVIVTFDEATSDATHGGGHVPTVMVGPNVLPGTTVDTFFTHFSLLAGLEGYFGLPLLAGAATASALSIPSEVVPATPTISGFQPTSGSVGDAVTISGRNLTDATVVSFGGIPAAFSVIDDTSIQASVPVGAVTGSISVTTPAGTATSDQDFVVVTGSPAIVFVTDAGFSPSIADIDRSSTVQWFFIGPSPQSVTESSLLGPSSTPLFDSGLQEPGGSYALVFSAAGTYPYASSGSAATGSVRVGMAASPLTGTKDTAFMLTWAAGPMDGYGFDVEYRFRPQNSGRWQRWESFVSEQPDPSGSFVPDRGARGTYQFRSRLVNAATGISSGFSPLLDLTVVG